MRALNRRERFLAIAALSALLAAFVIKGALAPQWQRYTRLQERRRALELDLTRMEANLRLKNHIEARHNELKDLIRHSGTASQEMSRFARLLTDLYRPLSLDVRSVRPLPDRNEEFYHQFALHLEMTGAIDQLAAFLVAVAEVPEPIRVQNIDIVCKDRPDVVTASLVITKVVTTQEPPVNKNRTHKTGLAVRALSDGANAAR